MANTLGKTEICNIALRRIGVNPINNVESDVSAAAMELRSMWDLTVENVLRSAEWSFARKVIPLAEVGDEKSLGWDYLYKYPADCSIMWHIENESSIHNPDIKNKWEKLLSPVTNTPCIACDVAEAYGIYTARITDPVLWDEMFVDALAWKLASEVCQRLASDTSLWNRCSTMYRSAIVTAQTMNKTENGTDDALQGAFITCR